MIFLKIILTFLLAGFFSWATLLLGQGGKRRALLAMILPEFLLTLILAPLGLSEVVLGLVLGSVLIFFLLLPGLVAIRQGKIICRGEFLLNQLLWAFLSLSLPLIFLLDKNMSRVEGLILLLLGCLFIALEGGKSRRGLRIFWPKLVLGLVFFLLSFSLLVTVAGSFSFPSLFVAGFVLLSLPVCLPEMVLFSSSRAKISFERVLAPLVLENTLILGMASFFSPFEIASFLSYLWVVIFILLSFALFYFFAWSKHKIERLEGVALVLFYFLAVFTVFNL
ncbi:hypothetical protein KBI33_02705 [Candidatus Shapirobacteria bacterium]|nr:hypothetical protein [Candidatus Shapirobacteria bacterium]